MKLVMPNQSNAKSEGIKIFIASCLLVFTLMILAGYNEEIMPGFAAFIIPALLVLVAIVKMDEHIGHLDKEVSLVVFYITSFILIYFYVYVFSMILENTSIILRDYPLPIALLTMAILIQIGTFVVNTFIFSFSKTLIFIVEKNIEYQNSNEYVTV